MAAIYQWFEIEVQVLTTTLYPVEFESSQLLGFSISEGWLTPIPEEAYDSEMSFTDFVMTQILLDYGPDTEAYDSEMQFQDFVVTQILLSYGPDTEQYDSEMGFLDFVMELKLVIVDTPDQEQQMAFNVKPGSCSMTPV